MKTLVIIAALLGLFAPVVRADEFISPFSPLWNWGPPTFIGKPATITDKRYFLNGAAATQPNATPDRWTRDTFDAKGKLSEESVLGTFDGKPYPPTSLKYDDKGRLVELTFRIFSGDVVGSHVLVYAPDGRSGTFTVNDAQNAEHKNEVSATEDLKFDDKGRVIEIKGSGGRYLFYNYTPEGRLDFILYGNKPESAEAANKVQYVYNDKGFVSEERQLRRQANADPTQFASMQWGLTEKMTYEYEYDGKGNWVRRTSTNVNQGSKQTKVYHLTMRTIVYAD